MRLRAGLGGEDVEGTGIWEIGRRKQVHLGDGLSSWRGRHRRGDQEGKHIALGKRAHLLRHGGVRALVLTPVTRASLDLYCTGYCVYSDAYMICPVPERWMGIASGRTRERRVRQVPSSRPCPDPLALRSPYHRLFFGVSLTALLLSN